MSNPVIKFAIGEKGNDFLARNSLSQSQHVDRQPAGINFYQYSWPVKQLGSVEIEHGALSFTIPYALALNAEEDVSKLDAGLDSLFVSAGITKADLVGHEEAKNTTYAFLDGLLKRGWRPFIAFDDPRLQGEMAFRYYQEDDLYSIPPDYLPTLSQWMQIDKDQWRLYGDGIFLTIRLMRDNSKLDINAPGAYLLNFSMQSKTFFARNEFSGQEREQWQNLWVDRMKQAKKSRYEKEALLTKRGFIIDSTYQDPKIHPLDPVEP
jgi:hypothetical protein